MHSSNPIINWSFLYFIMSLLLIIPFAHLYHNAKMLEYLCVVISFLMAHFFIELFTGKRGSCRSCFFMAQQYNNKSNLIALRVNGMHINVNIFWSLGDRLFCFYGFHKHLKPEKVWPQNRPQLRKIQFLVIVCRKNLLKIKTERLYCISVHVKKTCVTKKILTWN